MYVNLAIWPKPVQKTVSMPWKQRETNTWTMQAKCWIFSWMNGFRTKFHSAKSSPWHSKSLKGKSSRWFPGTYPTTSLMKLRSDGNTWRNYQQGLRKISVPFFWTPILKAPPTNSRGLPSSPKMGSISVIAVNGTLLPFNENLPATTAGDRRP